MVFENFDQVNQALQKHIPAVGDAGKALRLDRIKATLKALGDPQEQYPVVHVAGTSGKTSTSYYVASLLGQTGLKVGLSVSPHVEHVNERLQINLDPLNEEAYCKYFTEYYEIIGSLSRQPTYFELLVAFAFWVYAKEGVDYAVIEVGLGGLLDATNVVNRPNKVCVITDIGLDHTQVLGKTVAEIASKKVGIIHPHNAVFMYEQGSEVMGVVREVAEAQQAELHEIWPLAAKELPHFLPLFQRRNWYLALTVCQYVANRDKLPNFEESQLHASSMITIPGRMEKVEYCGKELLIDGAHNLQKIQTFFASYKALYGKQKASILFSLAQHKSEALRTILEAILPFAERLIITSIDDKNSSYKRSVNPTRIAEQCHLLGFDEWQVIADPSRALEELCNTPGPNFVVIGSFYLVGRIRPLTTPKEYI